MASIQRIRSPLTGDVSYRVQVRVKGSPALSETFPNKKEAEAWAASTEAAIRESRHFPHLKAKRTMFAEVAQRYRETIVKPEERTKPKQLDWWQKRFAGKTLAEITPDVVAAAREALLQETYVRGKVRTEKGEKVQPTEYRRSAGTVNRYLATLSHMLSIAVKEWRLIDRNPCSDISKRKEPRGRIRFLSDEERGRLLAACEKTGWPLLRTLVHLAITTGARRGELISLKWTDIDLKNGRALVQETKNDEPRSLPLVGTALTTLKELKLKNGSQSEFVFPAPSNFPEPYRYFDKHWYDALKTAKIENFRFHDLRHTTASYLAARGATLLEIADVLGHKTLAMVKRYAHLTHGHKASVIEKMATEKGL